jgi:predicted nucleic acid-binding protein
LSRLTYIDASVLVSIFIPDVFTPVARDWFRRDPVIIISDFAAAEFAAAASAKLRMRLLTQPDAQSLLDGFDAWLERLAARIEVRPEDIRQAERIVRRFELGLRVPDALHLALAQRHEAAMATFDDRMRAAAGQLHVEVEDV